MPPRVDFFLKSAWIMNLFCASFFVVVGMSWIKSRTVRFDIVKRLSFRLTNAPSTHPSIHHCTQHTLKSLQSGTRRGRRNRVGQLIRQTSRLRRQHRCRRPGTNPWSISPAQRRCPPRMTRPLFLRWQPKRTVQKSHEACMKLTVREIY